MNFITFLLKITGGLVEILLILVPLLIAVGFFIILMLNKKIRQQNFMN